MYNASYDNNTTTHINFYDPRLYYGVRTRRVFAFLIDYFLILLLCIPAAIVIAVLGIITLSLGWMLYAVMFPLVALFYVYKTLGGPNQATLGMQFMGISLQRLDNRPVDGSIAIIHTVLFWAFNALLTPLILLVCLFTSQKKTLHDIFLNTVVVRTDAFNLLEKN